MGWRPLRCTRRATLLPYVCRFRSGGAGRVRRDAVHRAVHGFGARRGVGVAGMGCARGVCGAGARASATLSAARLRAGPPPDIAPARGVDADFRARGERAEVPDPTRVYVGAVVPDQQGRGPAGDTLVPGNGELALGRETGGDRVGTLV